MVRIPRTASIGVIAILIGAAMRGPLYGQAPSCRDSRNIPLPDLTRPYRGLDIGLYPGRRTTPPSAHLAIGLDFAEHRIQPLDVNGKPSVIGKVILMSIGMSNTNSEFGRFIADASHNRAVSRQLTILNGSLSGADAAMWANPDSPPWQNATAIVNRGRGSSAKQVQVIWVKQTNLRTSTFPEEVEVLRANLASMVRIAKTVFPNLQIVYLSSRTRAGAETRRGPGEPQAYETAFAVRRLIQEQIERTGAAGAQMPWVTWGPYLWSNATRRSDGFVWECGDLRADMLHPTESGNRKVADQLMAFFMTAPTATPWFLERSLAASGPRVLGISPSIARGPVPLTVTFTPDVDVQGAVHYYWSFEDGTFSNASSPQKIFHVDGVYNVRLTVTDDSGKWTHSSVQIRAGASDK